jgi:hypothetical protein
VDVDKTIEFILDNQARMEVRVNRMQVRFDKRIAARCA